MCVLNALIFCITNLVFPEHFQFKNSSIGYPNLASLTRLENKLFFSETNRQSAISALELVSCYQEKTE